MKKRFVAAVVATLCLLMLVVAAPSPAAADGPGEGEPWIVSLGDSAISGEGGRWAGNSNLPAPVVDALGGAAYDDGREAGPITVAGSCLGTDGEPQAGSPVVPVGCTGGPEQIWQTPVDGTIRSASGLCLTASTLADGAALVLDGCRATGDQQWQRQGGRLLQLGSRRCADAPGSGAGLVLAACTSGSDQTQAFQLPDTYEQIRGCHRSQSAAVHIDRTSTASGPTPDVAVNSMNFACSGARTYTRNYSSGDDYKPGIDFATTPAGLPANHRGQAQMLEDFARDNNVTAVALMIGANNFGYATVLETCVLNWFFSPWWWKNYCSDDSAIAAKVTDEFRAQLTVDIESAIDNVRLAMSNAGYDESMYTVLVHTYWAVTPVGAELRYRERGYDRQTLGGCGFWNRDANWGERVARPMLNGAVTDAVTRSGHANVELVDLGDIVAEHELCDDSVRLIEETNFGHWSEPGYVDAAEWITQVRVGPALPDWLNGSPPEYQLQEGGHANYFGQLAMRNCLREAYNGGNPRSVSCSPAGGTNAYGEPALNVSTP